MKIKKLNICAILFLFLITFAPADYAQEDGFGQIIRINTRLDGFVGRPSWLLVIRDIDHNQNIPYLYDFTKTDNFWIIFTYSRHYSIIASTLQFAPYRSNPYNTRTVNNFCGLESHGRVMRGESLSVTITGKLTPNTNTFDCNVLRYADSQFITVN